MFKIRNALKERVPLDEAGRVQLLRFIEYTLAISLASAFILLAFQYQQILVSPLLMGLLVGFFAAILAAWLLVRRGRPRLAAGLFLGVFWLLLLVRLLASGGVGSPWVFTQISIALLAAIMIGGWSGVALAGLSLAADVAIYFLQSNHVVSGDLFVEGPDATWLALVLNFSLIALSILLARGLVRSSLLSAQEHQRRYLALFEHVSLAIFIVGPDELIQQVNQGVVDLLGYQPAELIGAPYARVVAPEEAGQAHENFERLRRNETPARFERTLVRKDGGRRQMEFMVTIVKDENGQMLYFQGVAQDISERKSLEQQLRGAFEEMERLATQDPLTGLLNRRGIEAQGEAEWQRAVRAKQPLCLVLMDMDDLKKINDRLGHMAGDQILVQLSRTLNQAKRRYDWAGRWGGDEFLVALPGANLAEGQQVAERVRALFGDAQLPGGMAEELRPNLSIGVAGYAGRPGTANSFSELMALADLALYTAKQQGKNRMEVFREEQGVKDEG